MKSKRKAVQTDIYRADLTDDAGISQAHQPARGPATRAAIEKYGTPPGFPAGLSARNPSEVRSMVASTLAKNAASKTSQRTIIEKAYRASWDAAFKPVRSILTSAFALYMTGSTVQFFSVGTTVTVLFMHIRSVMNVTNVFLTPSQAGVPKPMLIPQVLTYLILVGVGVAMGLFKANQLGFLPTTQSDWIALLQAREVGDGFIAKSVSLK